MLSKIVDNIKNMTTIEKKLENIGFTKKKADIYLAILELGESTVIDIAKKCNLKRTTVYNILPELISEGLVKKTSKNKRRYFFVDNPSLLKNILEDKIKNVESFLPELLSIQNVLPYKPKITFYEGAGGLKELYKDIIESSRAGDSVLSFTGLTNFDNLIPEELPPSYITNRIKKKIRTKIIATQSPTAKKWEEDAMKELREIKIINDPNVKFNADMEIYSNKIAIISYKENFMGVIIESTEISGMIKAMFNLTWGLL